MRTTVDIDTPVLSELKQLQRKEGKSLGRGWSPAQAMDNIQALLRLPHTRFLAEGDRFWNAYRSTTETVLTRGNLVPDAHLAALLRAHGVKTLYTHDRDFRRFDFLDVRDPLR